jgi:thiamine-monophosphate kinase
MSGPDPEDGPVDEFDWIDRCLRPLAKDTPEAFDLLDDAAALPARPGFDLVISADAIVEGVHFLPDDPADLIARKLLRVNLSDLAAKGAQPYAYILAIAWPARFGWPQRRAFAEGLGADQAAFGLKLLGGDTTSTPGPLSASVTVFGWVPAGAMVRRSGAAAGDVVLVSGTIGDGWLGLAACQGRAGLGAPHQAWLADRYRLPQPRAGLAVALRAHAHAAADVSDGLIADAGRIARASGVHIALDLDRLPLSPAARAWLSAQSEEAGARMDLACGGDDYEIVCTAPPGGRVTAGEGISVLAGGVPRAVSSAGWRHL